MELTPLNYQKRFPQDRLIQTTNGLTQGFNGLTADPDGNGVVEGFQGVSTKDLLNRSIASQQRKEASDLRFHANAIKRQIQQANEGYYAGLFTQQPNNSIFSTNQLDAKAKQLGVELAQKTNNQFDPSQNPANRDNALAILKARLDENKQTPQAIRPLSEQSLSNPQLLIQRGVKVQAVNQAEEKGTLLGQEQLQKYGIQDYRNALAVSQIQDQRLASAYVAATQPGSTQKSATLEKQSPTSNQQNFVETSTDSSNKPGGSPAYAMMRFQSGAQGEDSQQHKRKRREPIRVMA